VAAPTAWVGTVPRREGHRACGRPQRARRRTGFLRATDALLPPLSRLAPSAPLRAPSSLQWRRPEIEAHGTRIWERAAWLRRLPRWKEQGGHDTFPGGGGRHARLGEADRRADATMWDRRLPATCRGG
jgi:hypothetical protein